MGSAKTRALISFVEDTLGLMNGRDAMTTDAPVEFHRKAAKKP